VTVKELVCERHHEYGCPCSPQVWWPIPEPEPCKLCGMPSVLHEGGGLSCLQRVIWQLLERVDKLEKSVGRESSLGT
jgi:hypothetical protein